MTYRSLVPGVPDMTQGALLQALEEEVLEGNRKRLVLTAALVVETCRRAGYVITNRQARLILGKLGKRRSVTMERRPTNSL